MHMLCFQQEGGLQPFSFKVVDLASKIRKGAVCIFHFLFHTDYTVENFLLEN